MSSAPEGLPPLIDSHCHLNDPRFADDLADVIRRAAAVGIVRMVVVGYDLATSELAVRLAAEHAPVYAAVGIHPHDAQHYDADAREQLSKLAAAPKVVAIGEIGLDYHYDFSPREAQFAAFRDQLALARGLSLPVVIHCREAYADTLDVLENGGIETMGGVMHCWGGNAEAAARALALGMYLGFAGTVTFKNAEEARFAARDVPLDRLLVETDAPYLAPVPYRGKRNEPAYVRVVAERVAGVRGAPPSVIAGASAANARALFAGMR